ncbi:MAG: ABC transporter substrate-binding protein [Chloroflexota bacterium]|nr:ABC transporter substrate-binding protein [Chloroflexota bacterium]
MARRPAHLLAVFLVAVLVTACGSQAPAATQTSPTAALSARPSPAGSHAALEPQATETHTGGLTKVTLALGYIPTVQFAPFYVAAQRGFYREEGLDVEFQHGIVTDLLQQVGAGKLTYAVASGDEMLVARSQGVPLVYAGAYFQKYPVVLITPRNAHITSVRKIRGKTVGVPGPYGATYTGLKALLLSAGLTEQDVTTKFINFTQVQALQRGQVDAAMGYANNEPLQLERLGVPVDTIGVWENTNLVSNGIITNETNLSTHREQVGALVRATMRGLDAAIADPEGALRASLKYVPEAASQRELQLDVIRASIPLWQSAASKQHGTGYSDPAAWTATLQFLRRSGAITKDVDLSGVYTNEFVER